MKRSAAIVKTKLYCPHTTVGVVLRERLLEALETSLERPLTVVSAPAGYGKSVLVSDWIRSLAIPVAWVSLDEAESEFAQFLAYFLSALDSIYPGAFESILQWLTNPELPSPRAIAHELINTILEVDKPVVLVLDDYHHIGHSSVVHEFLQEILRHPPPNFHLVLVTRRDPPLALIKLRANNQLTELRQTDLRFDEAEATQLLSAAWGEIPDSAWIKGLQEAVEGWGAGLRMLALTAQPLHSSGLPLPTIPAGLHEIQEYLLQEVIEVLAPGLQYMLLRSAVPEKFCAELLDSLVQAVPGDRDSESDVKDVLDGAEFIRLAEQSNMFIVALDSSGIWYRYHHLFRELLLQQLQARLPADELALTQGKVASLLEELGMLNDAIRLYINAGRPGEAAEIVDRHRAKALDEDQWWQMSGWLQLFPADEIGKWPGTLFAKGWICQFNINLELISDLVRQLELIEKKPGLTKSQVGELDFFRSLPLFWAGDIAGARLMCERASNAPLGDRTSRAEVEVYLAITQAMDGEPELALQRIQELKVLDAGKRGTLASRLVAAELYVHYFSIATVPAAQSAARLAMISSTDFSSTYARGWAHYMHGLILFNTGRFQEAAVAFDRVIDGERGPETQVYIDLLAGKIICYTKLEDWEKLDSALSELEALSVSDELDAAKSEILASVTARSALLRADLESAIASAQDLPELPAAGNLFLWLEEPAITHIRVNLARGKPGPASAALKSIAAIRVGTVSQGLLCQDIDLMLLEAVAREQLGERDGALALLYEALSHAAPARWSRPFIELSALLYPLLQHSTLSEEYLDFLSIRCNLEGTAQPESSERDKVSDRAQGLNVSAEQFTNRELDILQLLAQRFRNKEIASQLYISTHTVNYHLKHIYQKLQISGRRMAVSRAIELGILED